MKIRPFAGLYRGLLRSLISAVLLFGGWVDGLAGSDAHPGYAEFLPDPLSVKWQRSEPRTTRAEQAQLGGGVITRAEYLLGDQRCVITISGDSPLLQSVAMTFSNPAVANMEGAENKRIGKQRVVITSKGEVQAFANNFLVQYGGDCMQANKFAHVQATDFDALRRFADAGISSATTAPTNLQAGLVWDRTFGGPASDWAYAMTGTQDGGLATAGRTESQGAGEEDIWIVRVDGDGNRLWDKTFGGLATDRGRAIKETRDGGFIAAGATESKGAGEFDAWVLRLDRKGELVWDRHFGGQGTDWASGVVQTRDGGFAIAAYTTPAPGEPFIAWIIKLDANGQTQWEQRFGGAATDWATDIAETTDGHLGISGYTESQGAGKADIWVLMLDERGDLLWQRTFGGAERDYASVLDATADGGLVVGGMTESAGSGGVDIRIMELAADGQLRWDQTYGGPRDDWVRGLIRTRDGRYAAAGYTTSKGAGLYDAWALRLDRNGDLLWDQAFGGHKNEWARAVIEMPDGSLALAGDNWSKGPGKSDVWVLRIAAETAD
ncbi:MAG: hypothetical protein ACR2QB_03900 [Gammaproteobacteria bacterium]